MSNKTVLIIDDEKDLLELVRYNLEKEGFDVILASDGQSGLDIATEHRPDVVVLDLMMPGKSGLEVCQQLRADPRTSRMPVIMLTAKVSEADRVVGLELGADDYVSKPFSPRELVARVKAVLRRVTMQSEAPRLIKQGDLTIDVERHEVNYGSSRVSLTATEFRILQHLASRAGKVLSRDEIINASLGQDAAVFDRTIDVHITSIRRKLGRGGSRIETVRGFGYKFVQDGEKVNTA